MTVRAKVCGIRSAADLETAVSAGADAVGFISGTTHFSEDALTAEAAAWLSECTPSFVNRVLVTHLEDAHAMLELADRIGADTIQVHGLVDSGTLRAVHAAARGRTIVRAVHVTGFDAVAHALDVAADCDAVLLDSRTADRLGGTGRTHDWSVSARIVRELASIGRPVILAGGLTADNVDEAIEAVRPFGVDVNSGVETESGDKDFAACAAFVKTAHEHEPGYPVPVPRPRVRGLRPTASPR
ncbi:MULTISPECIES: phosphoribosylanthranilate isomerase [Nocardia]|uniref:phosphoribosylanthranilate isomerase n=1 Tax=Nocardia TaxID=1817 RepID=UPI001895BAEA|nr:MULTISPECIES: phosphoribosylanthranilate isomerase [Nocardia]MBF6351826.1 phosphoribosylanthranilate isomerase [Nocardia flavorosea]